jgi:hypothetical protein
MKSERDDDSQKSHHALMQLRAAIVLVALAPASATGGTMREAVVTRSTVACHTPFDAIAASAQGRCDRLMSGQHVTIVSDDGDYRCVVYPGVQRCMWVHRDAIR